MRHLSVKKKGMVWSTIGKILLVIFTLFIAFMVLAKFSGKSFELGEYIKKLFGIG